MRAQEVCGICEAFSVGLRGSWGRVVWVVVVVGWRVEVSRVVVRAMG